MILFHRFAFEYHKRQQIHRMNMLKRFACLDVQINMNITLYVNVLNRLENKKRHIQSEKPISKNHVCHFQPFTSFVIIFLPTIGHLYMHLKKIWNEIGLIYVLD